MATQVIPLPASEVTVTIVTEESLKDGKEETYEPRTLKQNVVLGFFRTVASIGALCLLVIAIKFINDGFIILLAVSQR